MKLVELQNVVKYTKYSLAKFAYFQYICITCGNCHHFRLKNGNNFRMQYKHTENMQTSQGYIFCEYE
jgi:hypothetical protein